MDMPSGQQPTPIDLEAVGQQVCSRTVGSLFGELGGPASAASLKMGEVCRDWGVKGFLRAPLIDVIR